MDSPETAPLHHIKYARISQDICKISRFPSKAHSYRQLLEESGECVSGKVLREHVCNVVGGGDADEFNSLGDDVLPR